MLEIINNPNKEYYDAITEKVVANGGYCPCRVEKNDDTYCLCKETWYMFEDGVEGYCRCGRYLIQEKKENKNE